MNNLLKRIRESINVPDHVPFGYYSALQWAKKWKMDRSGANRLLVSGVRAKVVLKIRRRVLTAGGKLHPTNFYAEAPKKNK
jgi:hypothetical protein